MDYPDSIPTTHPNLPSLAPPLPPHVPPSTLLFIADIQVYESLTENALSPYPTAPLPPAPPSILPLGIRIFLPRLPDRTSYSFGAEERGEVYDVYVPIRRATKKLFEVVLDEEKDVWRIEAGGRTEVRVGGLEIRKRRGKKEGKGKGKEEAVLERVWVDPGREVEVRFRDGHGEMTIVLWLVKPERTANGPHKAQSAGLPVNDARPRDGGLEMTHRQFRHFGEMGGGERYIWDRTAEPISTKSWRVTDRFTGEIATAKVYQVPVGVEDRDREILMFAKENVHKSIVLYKEAVTLDGVPAAITDTHDSVVPLAVLELGLPTMHPGMRCKLAADMFRPLFGAIEYLHHNRIIHGSINSASVLLHMVDDKLTKLLLVDYSQSFLVDPGEDMPQDLLHFEGAEAMDLIATCSNLWTLRKAPLPGMLDQGVVQTLTEHAEQQYDILTYGAADFAHRRPAFFQTTAEPKLCEMLARAERKWAQAREAQILNADMMHVGPVTKAYLERVKEEWAMFSAGKEVKGEGPMALTLGHAWLDQLINPLRSASRYFELPTPAAVCTKLRSLGGDDPEPWQTFRVQQAHVFQAHAIGIRQQIVQIESRDLADYLAAICETYPELRQAIQEEYDRIIVPNGDMILPEYVGAFHGSLQKRLRHNIDINEPSANPLPHAMSSTLQALSNINEAGAHTITESYDITYHRPSQMFNVTQMHRFSTLGRLRLGINNNIRCDNFVEVRGQLSLEGIYVTLQMLQAFSNAFDLAVIEKPENRHGSILNDPSDFSLSTNRIVLVHDWLVGYASIDRRHGQGLHGPQGDSTRYPSTEAFLTTLFGDMSILPEPPNGVVEYPRPMHWAKYKTAKEMGKAAEVAKKNTPKSTPMLFNIGQPFGPGAGIRNPEAQCHLRRALQDREQIISAATTTYQPPLRDRDPDSPAAVLFRRAENRSHPSMTLSQMHAEPNLQRAPAGSLDKPIGPLDPVPFDPAVPAHVMQIMHAHFNDGPNDLESDTLDSDIRKELAVVGAYRRASPTEVDDTSVIRRMAPTTARGVEEATQEPSPDPLDRFPPLPASLRRHLPRDASSVHWRNSALPLDVRAFDARSFNDFGAQVAPAPTPQTKVGHTKDWQSFYAGQNNTRPRGVTVREHQRAGMSIMELEKMKESERWLGGRADGDGDEEMEDSDGGYGSDDYVGWGIGK